MGEISGNQRDPTEAVRPTSCCCVDLRPVEDSAPPQSSEVEKSQEMKRRSSSKSCLKKLIDDDDSSIANETTASSCPGLAKRVSFHTLEISEYPMEMGDNPSAVSGVPITIGWTPENKYLFNVEDYEARKPPSRNRMEMQIPSSYRYDMLIRSGATMQQMREAIGQSKKIQLRRTKSANSMKWDNMHFALESVHRKIKKVVSLGSLKKNLSSSSLKRTTSSTKMDESLFAINHSESRRERSGSERSDELDAPRLSSVNLNDSGRWLSVSEQSDGPISF